MCTHCRHNYYGAMTILVPYNYYNNYYGIELYCLTVVVKHKRSA